MVRPPRLREPLPPPFPGALRMDGAEEEAVRAVIRSKRLFRWSGVPDPNQPSKVAEFEAAFAGSMGAEHALAVNSGTSALVCALAGLEIGPGDEVIVPASTWIASATSVLAVGAIPVVADIDESLTIDPDDVVDKLSPCTKAIMPVHLRGAPAAMDRLGEIARDNRLALIEDTAQAVGATYRGRRLGTIGDVGAYSFQMSKIITAGEGGAIVTDSERVHRRALMYHDAGSVDHVDVTADEWLPGLNLRMSELHGAVMLVQLGRLDQLLADMRSRKAALKEMIESPLAEIGIRFRTIHDPAGEAAVGLILLLPDGGMAKRFASALERENIPAYPLFRTDAAGPNPQVYPGWASVTGKRAWSPAGFPWRQHPRPIEYPPDACSRTIEILSRSVNINISPDLSNEQLQQVAEAITVTSRKLG